MAFIWGHSSKMALSQRPNFTQGAYNEKLEVAEVEVGFMKS